jgi:hypothetical protein
VLERHRLRESAFVSFKVTLEVVGCATVEGQSREKDGTERR